MLFKSTKTKVKSMPFAPYLTEEVTESTQIINTKGILYLLNASSFIKFEVFPNISLFIYERYIFLHYATGVTESTHYIVELQ